MQVPLADVSGVAVLGKTPASVGPLGTSAASRLAGDALGVVHRLCGGGIQVRGVHVRVTGVPDVLWAPLVGDDEQDVRGTSACYRIRSRQGFSKQGGAEGPRPWIDAVFAGRLREHEHRVPLRILRVGVPGLSVRE